jgi:hypothetical protein
MHFGDEESKRDERQYLQRVINPPPPSLGIGPSLRRHPSEPHHGIYLLALGAAFLP